MHKDPIQSLFIGSKVIKLPSCHSTNGVASDLLAVNKLGHGTVILTDNQTEGRGQRGNSWESEPGKNLTFSVVVRPLFLPVSRQFELTVVSSLAITKTLESIGINNCCIKWPNDIFVGNKKIAGILIENVVRSNQLEWAILGIGLNVNQLEFATSGATSIKLELKQDQSLNQIFDLFTQNLNKYFNMLKQEEIPELRVMYNRKLMWINESRVFLDTRNNIKFKGVISSVGADGRLLIRSENDVNTFDFRQISFVGLND